MKFGAVAFASAAYLASLIPTADTLAYWDQTIAAHNSARAQYGAGPLTWHDGLGPILGLYVHNCTFIGTKGPYGENLYKTTNLNAGINDAIYSWMSEVSKYNYAEPRFYSDASNFTQVVWKNTTRVACAQTSCPARTLLPQASIFIACRYTIPGNVAGQFSQNVGHHV